MVVDHRASGRRAGAPPFEAASIISDEIGLRFCGVVEEAPRPVMKVRRAVSTMLR